MQTVAQPPQPYIWPCQDCGQPISFWDAGGRPDSDYYFVPVWCTYCRVQKSPFEEQASVLQGASEIERKTRRYVGLPSGTGTLIAFRDHIPNVNKSSRAPVEFPGAGFAIVVDAWNPDWPHPQYPWLDERFRFVVLAGYASAGHGLGAGCIVFWSWLYPDEVPSWSWDPPDFSPTRAEERHLRDARGALLKLRSRSGRPQGSGRFGTDKDFESAVFAAVAGLHKQKRRITQDAVGAYLIKKHGRNATLGWHAGDSPVDPGRQFREWCTRFKRDPEHLIQLAIAACASQT